MFNLDLIPDGKFDFALISDTHFMVDPDRKDLEFHSRSLQTKRAKHVLEMISSLDLSFVIHLGDLVQEFPEREKFDRAMEMAKNEMINCNQKVYYVAGNHDVGDKPDPTMPTNQVLSENLEKFHNLFGRSWHSWNKDGLHFIVLNSQILNSSLSEAKEQKEWLEQDLQDHEESRILLFLHLPLFINDESEPALGHYDNIANPDRDWLLKLIDKYEVEMVFSGHTHFSFLNEINSTKYMTVNSTSFTRPGFGELFSSCPPPEQGRNDVGKLGFYLIRVYEDRLGVHFIRTSGSTGGEKKATTKARLVTNRPDEIDNSNMGLSLWHPLAASTEVPIVFPSSIRQKARNDYPLLACKELGIKHLRVPLADFANDFQKQRLRILRNEGVSLRATCLLSKPLDEPEKLELLQNEFDSLEVQIAGSLNPKEDLAQQLQSTVNSLTVPVSLSTVMPTEKVSGKQHNRIRFGYLPEEVSDLSNYLTERDLRIDRVLCRLNPGGSPWDVISSNYDEFSFSNIEVIDWSIGLSVTDEYSQTKKVAEAVFASGLLNRSLLFVAPLQDLDRTMDVTYGLVDKLCNPRTVFQVFKSLNSILNQSSKRFRPLSILKEKKCRLLGLSNPDRVLWLLLPASKDSKLQIDLNKLRGFQKAKTIQCFDLETLTTNQQDCLKKASKDTNLSIRKPTLLEFSM